MISAAVVVLVSIAIMVAFYIAVMVGYVAVLHECDALRQPRPDGSVTCAISRRERYGDVCENGGWMCSGYCTPNVFDCAPRSKPLIVAVIVAVNVGLIAMLLSLAVMLVAVSARFRAFIFVLCVSQGDWVCFCLLPASLIVVVCGFVAAWSSDVAAQQLLDFVPARVRAGSFGRHADLFAPFLQGCVTCLPLPCVLRFPPHWC